AMPGDRVLVGDGSYVGGLLTAQGTAAAHITIAAQNPGKAILEGASEPLAIASSAYLDVDGFEVRNSVGHLVHVSGSNHLKLSNLYAHDAGMDGDVFFIEQSQSIELAHVTAARPGAHLGVPPARDAIELVGVSNASVHDSFV